MTLSPEQQLCVDAATSGSANLLISACAGGAKTTTMCAIARAFAPGRSIVALAFGTDAATALEQKMPYYVQSSTFHRFCFATLGTHLGRKPKPDGNRCKWLLKEMVPDWKQRRDIEDIVLTLISRFKSTTLPVTESNLNLVAERFDLDCGDSSLNLALRILQACLDDRKPKVVDFDDMLWLTFHWGVPFPAVAVVLLDEAQDTNGVQRALLCRMLRRELRSSDSSNMFDLDKSQLETFPACLVPTTGGGPRTTPGRLIAVGDPHQSIYGFRGADADAMPQLRSEFDMRDMSLNVSYRCSVAVVTEAQKYL